jgi:DNA-binding response OmpR family regulator
MATPEHVTETVLVVDDDATTRDVIVRYLEREGFRALEAEDGGRARAVIEDADPNLVILDLMLPGGFPSSAGCEHRARCRSSC